MKSQSGVEDSVKLSGMCALCLLVNSSLYVDIYLTTLHKIPEDSNLMTQSNVSYVFLFVHSKYPCKMYVIVRPLPKLQYFSEVYNKRRSVRLD